MKNFWQLLCEGKLSRSIPAVAPDPAWPAKYEIWSARLAGFPEGDPFWNGLLALLDQYVISELAASVTPGLSSDEAHRFRGRLGMLLDLRHDLVQAMQAAREGQTEKFRK
jgi:hypothetical protein